VPQNADTGGRYCPGCGEPLPRGEALPPGHENHLPRNVEYEEGGEWLRQLGRRKAWQEGEVTDPPDNSKPASTEINSWPGMER
jgi:hypothetical protein